MDDPAASPVLAPVPTPVPASTVTRARWGVALVFFVNGAAFASWVSRIPALRAGLALSDGALGSVLFALSCGVLLSFPLAGRGTPLLGARQLALLAGVVLLVMLPMPFLDRHRAVAGAGAARAGRRARHDAGGDERARRRRAGPRAAPDHVVAAWRLERGRPGRCMASGGLAARTPTLPPPLLHLGRGRHWRLPACCCWR